MEKIQFRKPLLLIPNFLTGSLDSKAGYNWGKKKTESLILKKLFHKEYPDITKGDCQKFNMPFFTQDEKECICERYIVSDDSQSPSNVFFSENKIFPLNRLFERFGESLLGTEHMEVFGPNLKVIMKQIDTNQNPEVGSFALKVHADNGHPLRKSRFKIWLGKGSVYLGWNKDMRDELIRNGIKNGVLEKDLNCLKIDPSTALFVPGSIVYAIRYGTFLIEWTVSPWKEDTNPSNPESETISLYDRTDGRTPKRENENVNAALEIFKYGSGLSSFKFAPKSSKEIFEDENGNKIRLIAENPHVFVEKIEVNTLIELSAALRGFPLYLDKGAVEILVEGQKVDSLSSGAERFIPATMGKFVIRNLKEESSILYKWYSPFPWMLDTEPE